MVPSSRPGIGDVLVSLQQWPLEMDSAQGKFLLRRYLAPDCLPWALTNQMSSEASPPSDSDGQRSGVSDLRAPASQHELCFPQFEATPSATMRMSLASLLVSWNIAVPSTVLSRPRFYHDRKG